MGNCSTTQGQDGGFQQRQLSLSSALGAGKRQGREVPGSPSTAKANRRDNSSVSPQQVALAMVGDTDPAAAAAQGFSEQALQQWKVFNELDTQDEADMMDLATFFQTLSGSGVLKDVDMDTSEQGINLDAIKIDNVGRLDSQLHDLDDFEIPAKGKITIETALDVIDCFRRGGKLHVQSVHKILKDVYWMLKKLPNVREASLPTGAHRVTVVGDLHGQFADLLYILDTTGAPNDKNLYVFNGDFVDRGPCSLQVILTLFCLQLAEPTSVFLNRGNHEDAGICCVFGFMKECLGTYDEVTFSMFVEVFRYLPLATIIASQVLVLHGGLFSQPGVLVEEMLEANRKDYNLADDRKQHKTQSMGSGKPTDDMDLKEYLDQVVRDMLWSDPHPHEGRRPNPRGEGVHFGPDVTEEFLRENRLNMIVRSHECVPLGFGQPYDGDYKELLCTIFSASNYSSSGNHGAFLRFSTASSKGAKEIRPVSSDPLSSSRGAGDDNNGGRTKKLYYSVNCYYIGDPLEQERCLREATQASLATLIMKKRVTLLKAFQEQDNSNCGHVSIDNWAEVMVRVTRLGVQWSMLLPLLLPGFDTATQNTVDYNTFLNNFQTTYGVAVGDQQSGKAMFDALYANRKQLEAMFAFFDKDGNGSISRDEFRQGCEYLNHVLPADEKLNNVDRLLDLLDFDKSNSIEVNEFFEAFRLLDLKDGKLDGQIDLPTEQYMRKHGDKEKRRGSGPRIIKVGGQGDMAGMLQQENNDACTQDLYDDSDDDNFYGANNGSGSPRASSPAKLSTARAPSPRQAVRGS